MLARTDLRGADVTLSQLRRALPRGGTDINSVLPVVTPVVEAIAEHGAASALDYTERFDKVRPASVQVRAQMIAQARADQRRSTTVTRLAPGAPSPRR